MDVPAPLGGRGQASGSRWATRSARAACIMALADRRCAPRLPRPLPRAARPATRRAAASAARPRPQAAHRRGRVRARLCRPGSAQAGARTRRRPRQASRAPASTAASCAPMSRLCQGRWRGCRAAAAKAAPAPAAAAGRLDLLPWPKVDFAKFGPDRAQGAVAHQEDLGGQPASQLGRDPACHARTTKPTSPTSKRSACR